jgi:hypothetical protein
MVSCCRLAMSEHGSSNNNCSPHLPFPEAPATQEKKRNFTLHLRMFVESENHRRSPRADRRLFLFFSFLFYFFCRCSFSPLMLLFFSSLLH